MNIIGYGEDSLTLWALSQHIQEFLANWEDHIVEDRSVLYYRPSFGRAGNPPIAPGGVANSPQFGEFDAILGSGQAIYLIESKWSRSPIVGGNTIQVNPVQVLRHHIMREYIRLWRNHQPNNWGAFINNIGPTINVDNVQFPVAPLDSQLAASLETVLSSLINLGKQVIDVLLYIHLENGPLVEFVDPDMFQLVTIQCEENLGFVNLMEV